MAYARNGSSRTPEPTASESGRKSCRRPHLASSKCVKHIQQKRAHLLLEGVRCSLEYNRVRQFGLRL